MAGNSRYPFADRATAWAKKVASGKLKQCEFVRLACQRHLNDLVAAKDKAYPYEWDRAAANRIAEFAELMVHVKGKWAGQPIRLEDWQCFMLCVPFGWLRRDNGLRRFREIYDEIPRKNAKSTEGAIIGLYLAFDDGEAGAEVYSGATTLDQAMAVFWTAWMMVYRNPDFQQHFGLELGGTAKNPGPIYNLADGSRFEAIIGKPGDGASPHGSIVDEYHEHQGPELYDTMKTGMGARTQPMQVVITTAGTNIAGPCYEHRSNCVKVLRGALQDDTLFVLIFAPDEGDDWRDFEVWRKVNPNLGVSVQEDYLRTQHRNALQIVSKQNINRTKHLNEWLNAGAGWMNMAKWAACARPGLIPDGWYQAPGMRLAEWLGLPLDELKAVRVWLGVDLASKVDLADVVALLSLPDGSWAAAVWHFLPSDTVELDHNSHYQRWRDEGWLSATDGARTDFHAVERLIELLAEDLNVLEMAYDPKEASYLVQNIQTWAGFECVEVPQGPAHMSEPMKELEALVADGKIQHPNDPVFTWEMSNVVVKTARGGGPVKYQYPTKDAAANKIDGAVATIMALGRGMAAPPPEPPPNYEVEWL